MSEFAFISDNMSVAAIRDYLFNKKIDKGDSLIFNPMDYEKLIEEIKNSGDPIQIPVNVLGVLLIKDASGDIPVGKVQIVENEKM